MLLQWSICLKNVFTEPIRNVLDRNLGAVSKNDPIIAQQILQQDANAYEIFKVFVPKNTESSQLTIHYIQLTVHYIE